MLVDILKMAFKIRIYSFRPFSMHSSIDRHDNKTAL